MNYKGNAYPHSFILCKDNIVIENLSDFEEVKLFEYSLFHSESYSVTLIDKGNVKHMLLGYSLDIRNSKNSDEDILEILHQSDSVIKELEYIAGRYIYIKAVSNEMYVYSDASQLLPLVFNKEAQILSSHDNLLAEILTDNRYKVTRRALEVHNELDFTRFAEIQKFNPSMRLRTKDFTYRRIYPRTQLATESVDIVYKRMKPYLTEMINWLKKNTQPKFLTVTGGIDSRVSAALSKEIEGIEYLTYFMPDNYIRSSLAKAIYATDKNITTQMKDNLQWNHEIIDLTEIPLSKDELKFYEQYYNSKHGYRLDKYYREHKNYYKALHIKSTVFGMGKADFPASLDAKASSSDYYRRSVHGISKQFEEHYDIEGEIDKYFERNLVEPSVTKGRHYFDLYHLESRMGNWHSSLTLETDPETEEFIFTNSRKLIDLIQLPPIAERRDFSLYKKIINQHWPLLLFFGINTDENLYEQNSKLTVNKLKNIIVYGDRSLKINKQKNMMTILPADHHINLKQNYYCVVENNSKDTHAVTLRSDYDKESARGSIRVVLRYNNKVEEYDIVDLNNGINISEYGKSVHINILFNKEYDSESWRKAATLKIDI